MRSPPRKKIPKFYRIKWIDAFGPTSAWTDVKELDLEPCYCLSHGFLVARDKNYTVLAPHIAGSGDVCGDLKIPNTNIVETVELVEKTKPRRK